MNVPYLVAALGIALIIPALMVLLTRKINESKRAGDGDWEWLMHVRRVLAVSGLVLVVILAVDAVRR